MAGNILYIPYAIILIIVFIGIGIILAFKKGKPVTRKYFIVVIPIFIIFQFYFWNFEFNGFVKSFITQEKVFECDTEEIFSIPLPSRTTLKSKEDGCLPNYITYTSATKFKTFYDDELSKLKYKRILDSFMFEEHNNNGIIEMEYTVYTSTGNKVTILFVDDSSILDDSRISIDFH